MQSIWTNENNTILKHVTLKAIIAYEKSLPLRKYNYLYINFTAIQ